MTRLFSLLALLPFSNLQAQQPAFQWAKSVVTLENPYNAGFPTQQAIDVYGNSYTTGYFKGTRDFDPGPGTFSLTSANDLGVYITKLDAEGNFIWARAVADIAHGGDVSNYQNGIPIAIDADGNVVITGFFSGTPDFDPGPDAYPLTSVSPHFDVFVLQLNSEGAFQWAKSTGSEAPDSAESFPGAMTLDDSGAVYVTGRFKGTVDFDPGPGVNSLSASGNSDVFLLKLDAKGQFIWAKAMGGANGSAEGNSIALTASHEIVLCGSFDKTIDADPGPGAYNLMVTGTNANTYATFTLQLDAAGDFLWAESWSGNKNMLGFPIKINASGEIYMAGLFDGKIDFDPGPGVYEQTGGSGGYLFVLKLSAGGQFEWVKILKENVLINRASGPLALDASGNLYLTGYYAGLTDFDPGPDELLLDYKGYTDIFLLSLNPAGDFRWVGTIGGPGQDYSTCVVPDQEGNIYFTGAYNGVVDFDPGLGVYNLPLDGIPFPSNVVFISKWQQTTVSLDDVNTLDVLVYPNPSTGVFSVQLQDNAPKLWVEIYDREGKRIYQQPYDASKTVSMPAGAPAGTYFVHLKSDNGLQTVCKVVKK